MPLAVVSFGQATLISRRQALAFRPATHAASKPNIISFDFILFKLFLFLKPRKGLARPEVWRQCACLIGRTYNDEVEMSKGKHPIGHQYYFGRFDVAFGQALMGFQTRS